MFDDDRALERQLAASRRRRATAARVMVVAVVIPIAVQAVFVSLGLAVRFGLIAVALPAAVAWIIVRGRRR